MTTEICARVVNAEVNVFDPPEHHRIQKQEKSKLTCGIMEGYFTNIFCYYCLLPSITALITVITVNCRLNYRLNYRLVYRNYRQLPSQLLSNMA